MPISKSDLPRWLHQEREYRDNRDRRSRALLWPMRSGKSRACVDVACCQYKRGKIEGVIVIAPNGVHLNWACREVPTWGWPGIAHRTFAWETTKQRLPEKQQDWTGLLQHSGLRWFCVNMDALRREDCKRAIRKFQRSCHFNFMLIVSEAHHFGRISSKRHRTARNLSYHANFVRIETGTPILTGPLKAYAEYELIAPGALGFSKYSAFEENFADMVPAGRIVPNRHQQRMKVEKYKNLNQLTAKIGKWSSLVLREDLEDMPELIHTERPCVMGDAQRAAYLKMVAEHLAQIEDVSVEVPDAGPRMMKLQQILMGYVMDTETKRVLTIDAEAPIYDAVLEQVAGTLPGKALVWCRYKEDCRRVTAMLRKNKFPVLEYWGDFTTTVREANRAKFLRLDDSSTIVGTPDCGGEGLDFSAAEAVIFASVPPNARMIAQAEERATVKGGKSVAIVRCRHYGTVDDRMWQIIDGNISLADTVTGRGLRALLLQTDI